MKFKKIDKIFVFGSNEGGRHGKGAALDARLHYGAIYGQAFGLQGNSFAIPTKGNYEPNSMGKMVMRTLSIGKIKIYVDKFIKFAYDNPTMEFYVTPIGCGLAGFKCDKIAPLFKDIPANVELAEELRKELD